MSTLAFSPSTNRSTAPPITSLDSPKNSSPLMLLSNGRGAGPLKGNKCLALMWPSSNEDESSHVLSPVSPSIRTNLGGAVMQSAHKKDSFDVNSPLGKGRMSLDRTTEVIVCPSGQTVIRMKASAEAVLSSPSSDKGSKSAFKQLSRYSPPSSPPDRSRYGSPSIMDSSQWPHPKGSTSPSITFPGRNLLYDSGDKGHSKDLPSPGRSPSPTRTVSSGGDTPLPGSFLKRIGTRRRKVSGKDRGDRGRLIGGAKGILEQDHPEEDVTSHSRCPCFKFFLLTCLAVVLLALLFYLSLWLVAQHRASPIIVAGGENFQTILETHVFGQPLVTSLLPVYLSGILDEDTNERTVIVLFQGQSGTGKTYVADLIQNYLFSDQANQQCSYKFLPSYNQIKDHLVTTYDYSIALEDFIDQGRSGYRTCPLVVYIIEDLDWGESRNLLQAVAFTLDSVRKRQQAQKQKMAFLLVSNMQGEEIGEYTYSQFQSFRKREDITLEELTPVLRAIPSMEISSDSEKGNDLKEIHSKFLSIIDHHIPFFPLEREHVKMCIKRTFTKRNITLAHEDIEWVADKLFYFPDSDPVFSISGCKKVEEKASLFSKYTRFS